MNKKILITLFAALFASQAHSNPVEKNTARLQAMDKITGTSSILEIAINTEQKYEDFSIVVRKCKANPPEDTPESFAFVDIAEITGSVTQNIYKGWMLSSSPSLNPLEHPMYDLWLLECINKDTSKEQKLTDNELQARDDLESTQIMPEVQEVLEPQEEVTENNGEPETIINIDSQVEFNATEEANKEAQAEVIEEVNPEILPSPVQKEELEQNQNDVLELLEKPVIEKAETTVEIIEEVTPQNPTEEVKEEIKEEVVEEAKEDDTQLIDFSNMQIEE